MPSTPSSVVRCLSLEDRETENVYAEICEHIPSPHISRRLQHELFRIYMKSTATLSYVCRSHEIYTARYGEVKGKKANWNG